MAAKKKKAKAKAKAHSGPKADKRFRKDIDDFFERSGFTSFDTGGTELTIGLRKGDIDHAFVFENVLVICERTTAADVWAHLAKKTHFFAEILKDPERCIKTLRAKFPAIEQYAGAKPYENSQYHVRIVYCSIDPVEEEHQKLAPGVYFADYRYVRYFSVLAKAIRRSARVEIFKYFSIGKGDIGEDLLAGAQGGVQRFLGMLLPENHSSFPPGHRLVSFYADPKRLLDLGYVLRRDGWEAGVYQRIVGQAKLRSMRNYLNRNKRVYINNIIVTLPATTKLNEPDDFGKNIDAKDLAKPRYVSIAVPDAFNIVGIVDGQHRVLSYHESDDALEPEIRKLRDKQNLLVTGIIYPNAVTAAEQVKFEAELFLEINSNQTTAKAELKQAIALLVDPFAHMSIARAVGNALGTQTPLVGLLQESALDDRGKLKISSIVSYGLKPLVKPDGDDSLFSVWTEVNKEARLAAKDAELLSQYIKFCTKEIRMFLAAAKEGLGHKKWQPKDKIAAPDGVLTTTFLNAMFVCFRRVIANGDDRTFPKLKVAFGKINKVDFTKFKRSSLWAQMGDEIYKVCFG